MRVLLVIVSVTAGALAYRAATRYTPALLWWVFTTDIRSTR